AMDEARGTRTARRTIESREGRADRGERVQVDHVREPKLRSDREPGRARGEADLRDDEQPPPVDPIGDDPTEERERYQGDRLEESDELDVQRRARQQIDLVGDGHETQLRPGEGHKM